MIRRPAWTEIDLDSLAFNFRSCRAYIGESVKYMAVVKADAYGHGSVECAKRLEAEGIDWFGVAIPEEALELRDAGIVVPVLSLGGFWEGQEDALLAERITPVIFRIEQAICFGKAAISRGMTANIHVKIDTGMGRLGVRFNDVGQFAEALKAVDGVNLEGVMSHLAAADDLTANDFTTLQQHRLNEAAAIFRQNGFSPSLFDMANSPGAVAHPEVRGNLVRLGGILYGLGGDVLPREIEKPELRPVLGLYSEIAHLKAVPAGESLGYSRTFTTKKDSLIATVPIGYHDGYRRSLSNRGRVLVNGIIAPVVGRISMDWTIVDVTDVPKVAIGDRVTLIGATGGQQIRAEDLAAELETISYEITCGINRRVERRFIGIDAS